MNQDYSYWEHDAISRLWDVCIIGSGINGISTGISILEKAPGTSVLVLDRWFVPLGASTRNAGFSCFGSPSEILSDIKSMGEAEALALVERRWKGLRILQQRLQHSDAQYESSGGYELYHQDELEAIQGRLPYLNDVLRSAIGLKQVFEVVEVPPGIRGFQGAVFNPHEGQLHPARMMKHLQETYSRLGGKLWTGIDIEEIEERDEMVFLNSRFAFPVTAKKVIVATNAFARKLLPQLDVHGARNHVLVTEPVEGLQWKGCFHYNEGFYYFRNIGQRILLGGARNQAIDEENTEAFGKNEVILDALMKFLHDHLVPDTVKIEYEWSGIIALGSSKLPIIEAVSSRIFAGVRCSGMGIALASLTGERLADMVLQQPQ